MDSCPDISERSIAVCYDTGMARRWTKEEEDLHCAQLSALYVAQNKTIGEIASLLNIAPQTVFDRLRRLGIETRRQEKPRANNRRSDIAVPHRRSRALAELFGVLLGDGHVGHFQTVITLGRTERSYAEYVALLLERVCNVRPHIGVRKGGHLDVYLGSTAFTRWLHDEGLPNHKVRMQVNVPEWIVASPAYSEACIRGLFDTDGCIYALRHGIQVSFSNRSVPLLCSLQKMLKTLGYTPSAISGSQLYLTKTSDIDRFFRKIRPANEKHLRRNARFRS